MIMTIYRLTKEDFDGTSIEIMSENKILFNRLELAIDHVFKQYAEEKEKKLYEKELGL